MNNMMNFCHFLLLSSLPHGTLFLGGPPQGQAPDTGEIQVATQRKRPPIRGPRFGTPQWRWVASTVVKVTLISNLITAGLVWLGTSFVYTHFCSNAVMRAIGG